jgi:hypothetical protein
MINPAVKDDENLSDVDVDAELAFDHSELDDEPSVSEFDEVGQALNLVGLQFERSSLSNGKNSSFSAQAFSLGLGIGLDDLIGAEIGPTNDQPQLESDNKDFKVQAPHHATDKESLKDEVLGHEPSINLNSGNNIYGFIESEPVLQGPIFSDEKRRQLMDIFPEVTQNAILSFTLMFGSKATLRLRPRVREYKGTFDAIVVNELSSWLILFELIVRPIFFQKERRAYSGGRRCHCISKQKIRKVFYPV